MSDPFLGEVKMFAGNFAPRGYAFCDGQILAIAQNTALFSLLGTTYGGNGTTTFGLPDLRGRVPVGMGQGPGLSPYQQGQSGGAEAVALSVAQMPAHNHTFMASGNTATAASGPTAALGTSTTAIYGNGNASLAMSPEAIAPAGNGQPHNNMAPSRAVSFIIALQGIYPSRN